MRIGDRVISLHPPLITEPKNVRVRGTVSGHAVGSVVGVRFDGIPHEIFMGVVELRRLDLIEQLGELG